MLAPAPVVPAFANGNGTGSIIPATPIVPGPTGNQLQNRVDDAAALAAKSPTVISSSNIDENVIPDLKAKLDKYSNTGVYQAADGSTRYADNTIVPQDTSADQGDSNKPALGDLRAQGGTYVGQNNQKFYNYDNTPVTSDETDMGLLTNMQLSNDATTKMKMDSAMQQYDLKKQNQESANAAADADITMGLLSSGSTKYAASTPGLMSAEQKSLAMNIAGLNAEENSILADAKAAHDNQDFQILQQKLDLLETKRKEKQAAADKLNESITTENKATQKAQIQASRDNSVAGIVAQGVTDPAAVLDLLNNHEDGTQVGDFSADEVSKTLKALTVAGTKPTDLPADVKTFEYIRDNYGLPEDISSLPANQQYFAYLKSVKAANTAPAKSTTKKTPTTDTSTPSNAPSWDDYKAAATKLMGTSYLMAADEAELRAQYDKEYGSGGTPAAKFTPTEQKKLEQAGLGKATRQQQLDFLYGKKPAAPKPASSAAAPADTSGIPDVLK